MKRETSPLNIVLLCLDHTFCKSVAGELSSRLGMFFSDCKDLCLNEDDIARTEKRLLDKLIQLHEDGRYIMDENILTKLILI